MIPTKKNKKNHISEKNVIKTEWTHPELSNNVQKICTCKNCGNNVNMLDIYFKKKINYF